MADLKKDELGKKVAHDPSLMTGAIPVVEPLDNPVVFKSGNYCYPAKKSMVEYHSKSLPGIFGEPREWDVESVARDIAKRLFLQIVLCVM